MSILNLLLTIPWKELILVFLLFMLMQDENVSIYFTDDTLEKSVGFIAGYALIKLMLFADMI